MDYRTGREREEEGEGIEGWKGVCTIGEIGKPGLFPSPLRAWDNCESNCNIW